MNRLPLRIRVALGYGLCGLGLSLAFAIAIGYLAEAYEGAFVSMLLKGQAATYLDELARNPDAELPRAPGLAMYREANAPPKLQHLGLGIHEIEQSDQPDHEELHVGVFEAKGQRLVIVLDMGQVEVLERFLGNVTIAVVLGGTLLSALLGWMLAERAIRPVARLALAVEALPLRPVLTKLSEGLPQDGIGRLAAAVDKYQARLSEAGSKERAFFADASHELRTPLAVIKGAVEVIKDDPVTPAAQFARLGRIDRSAAELELLLEALLLSGRDLPSELDLIDLREICEVATAQLVTWDPSAADRIRVAPGQPLMVEAPRRWANCVAHVLVFKLLSVPGSTWEIRISDATIAFVQPRSGWSTSAEIRRSDLGLGFHFVERLCRMLGWQLRQYLSDDAGLWVELEIRSGC